MIELIEIYRHYNLDRVLYWAHVNWTTRFYDPTHNPFR